MTAAESSVKLDTVEQAIADIAAGKAVVVVDNEDRENEGDLIFAAELATPELVAFMVRYTSGYICAPLMPEDCARLNLPPMIAVNEDVRHTAYTVTVDAATGSTGISAGSRAETIRRLADPTSEVGDFTRPGHVVPLAARPGGVLERDGHIGRVFFRYDLARSPELRRFADAHGLSMISIEQLIEWRRHQETQIVRSVSTRLPTEHGVFTAIGYTHDVDKSEHIALIAGDVDALKGAENVLVRVHSECLTGDVFGSRRCDCGPQLNASLQAVQEAGQGVVVYLRGQEGRGIGLVNKLKAYHLQDKGLDTVDANLEQGLPEDAREYSVAGQILRDLGIVSVNLMTNNPHKGDGLFGFGVDVSQHTNLAVAANEDNITYLRTKRDRMGHDLPQVAQWDSEHS